MPWEETEVQSQTFAVSLFSTPTKLLNDWAWYAEKMSVVCFWIEILSSPSTVRVVSLVHQEVCGKGENNGTWPWQCTAPNWLVGVWNVHMLSRQRKNGKKGAFGCESGNVNFPWALIIKFSGPSTLT